MYADAEGWEMKKLLIDHGYDVNEALLDAVCGGDCHTTELLLLNYQPCLRSFFDVYSEFSFEEPKVLKLLLDHGFPVDKRDIHGETLLMVNATADLTRCGNDEPLVRILL